MSCFASKQPGDADALGPRSVLEVMSQDRSPTHDMSNTTVSVTAFPRVLLKEPDFLFGASALYKL